VKFPEKLRKLRERAGLTPPQLAEKAKLSRATVYALEAGSRKPSLEVARQLCKAMACSLAEFD